MTAPMRLQTFADRHRDFFDHAVRQREIILDGQGEGCRLTLCAVSMGRGTIPPDFLSPSEKEAYDGFRHQRRRESYLLGKLCAKLALAGPEDELDRICVVPGILCQPVAEGRDRRITITHCGERGVAAAYDPRLLAGVDLEAVSERHADAMSRVTTDHERRLMEGLEADRPTALTVLWTAKEAMSKAIQTGFTASMDLFETGEITVRGAGFVSGFRHFPQFVALSSVVREQALTLALPRKAVSGQAEQALMHMLDELLQPL